ncbi:hypothetical protein QMK19_23230 [Streptomyces sp. H10-C2]|uniref:hypothetical protein n=1 Tax=unclassified Streptomyces TaxID=2593676 RepID=UPI0024B8D22E|nr:MULTISPECIES: hypothetical protein [unclassified Streptomyces]MDJ0342820.1 hypothetical protein [Streptomyces sp. PH10-H1]MDJ0372498.1 hypothetical protein [Streptomyces sp. H10-C2]
MTALARTITNIFQPMNTLLAGMTGIGAAATGTWSGAAWGAFAGVFAGVVPATYVNWERKRGTWGDRHVVDRAQRRPIFLVILSSIATAAVVMLLAGAPRDVLIATIALWVMTVGLLTVNDASRWKISVDCAVASAVVAMLSVVATPWWLLAYSVVGVVCWTRTALSYHTVAQTAAGAGLGLATAGVWLL